MNSHNKTRVKTTDTSLEIVELIHNKGPKTRKELESHFGLTTSTVHRHLATLQDHGYVTKDGSEYRLGYKFLTIGGDLRRKVPGYPMIKRQVNDLAEETDERAQFIIREGQERVYLYTSVGANPVQTGAQTGGRGPIYASAAGKSILAFLPEEKREQLLDTITLNAVGPNTITDVDQLRDTLDEIRDRGYATNIQESTSGVHAIGAPVITQDGTEPLGAFSISGPASRLKEERIETEVQNLVLSATNELELHLEHS